MSIPLFGSTRSRLTDRHAFLAPDSQVRAPAPGWHDAELAVQISPQLGSGVSARFTQTLAWLEPGGEAGPPLPGVERFVYLLGGEVTLEHGGGATTLGPGGYAWLPPDAAHRLRAGEAARLVLFERRYLPLPAVATPEAVVGRLDDHPGEPFLGDAGVRVRRLLPDAPGFDLAVNTMSFRPGAALPFVEVHPNEHGLLMLEGGGIYRLDDAWYPVREGDAIWMGPFCPQWFGALGATEATYLLYKDVGRDWLAFAEAG